MVFDRPDKKLETWIAIISIIMVIALTVTIFTRAVPKREVNLNARTKQTITVN